jgi:hypothetical protein
VLNVGPRPPTFAEEMARRVPACAPGVVVVRMPEGALVVVDDHVEWVSGEVAAILSSRPGWLDAVAVGLRLRRRDGYVSAEAKARAEAFEEAWARAEPFDDRGLRFSAAFEDALGIDVYEDSVGLSWLETQAERLRATIETRVAEAVGPAAVPLVEADDSATAPGCYGPPPPTDPRLSARALISAPHAPPAAAGRTLTRSSTAAARGVLVAAAA